MPAEAKTTLKNSNEPSHRIYKSRKELAFNNLIAGIAWGVGSVVGATLVVALIGLLLAQSKQVPFLGTIIDNISYQLEQQNPTRSSDEN